jgi:hypothetical protein
MRAIDLTGGEFTGQVGQLGVVYRIYVIGHKVIRSAPYARLVAHASSIRVEEDLQASVHRRCTDCPEL